MIQMAKFAFKNIFKFLRQASPGYRDPAAELSPQVLAYVGDAVFELYIRTYLVGKERAAPAGALHRSATCLARAGGQASLLRKIQPLLTEEETRLVKRGRNSGGRVPKGARVADYRQATGLEALLGTLYLEGRVERLQEITEFIFCVWDES